MSQIFQISGEFIELNKLLKASGICMSGGQAKQLIEGGMVLVNDEPESRKRRKILPGMKVKCGDEVVEVTAE